MAYILQSHYYYRYHRYGLSQEINLGIFRWKQTANMVKIPSSYFIPFLSSSYFFAAIRLYSFHTSFVINFSSFFPSYFLVIVLRHYPYQIACHRRNEIAQERRTLTIFIKKSLAFSLLVIIYTVLTSVCPSLLYFKRQLIW